MQEKIKQISFFFWLNRQNFNYFKCSKWWSVCKCCWSSKYNSSSKFYFIFFANNRNNQEITEHNKKQKKKQDKILLLSKSKLNGIETSESQALIDIEICHEKCITILEEKNKYEKIKKIFEWKIIKYHIKSC